MYGRKGFWAGPELSTRGKASGGKTLDFDAGFTPWFLPSNSCLGCAITAAAARESERSVFISCRVFGRAVSEITAICRNLRRPAPASEPIDHRANRQTSTPPRQTSYASSGADWVHPSCSRMPPFCYSTSQEPEEAGASPPTASLRRQPPWRTRRTASGADEGPSIICSNVGDGADQSHKACLLP